MKTELEKARARLAKAKAALFTGRRGAEMRYDNALNDVALLEANAPKAEAVHCHHDRSGKCPYAYTGTINGGIPRAACKLPYDKPCPKAATKGE